MVASAHMPADHFPGAVPEIPVANLVEAAQYYEKCFGFRRDWGGEGGGIGQVSRGDCRLFLTDDAFRAQNGSTGAPVVIWLNLNSKSEVDELYEAWLSNGARIVSQPESKPWHLHEFLATDLDGNMLRVFYDFAWELPDGGGRQAP
jgi:uncharacterized glyoxalase superfamily protein PhnB